MKIKLSKNEWKQVIESLHASGEIEMLESAKAIEKIVNKIEKAITPKLTEVYHQSFRHGWGMMQCGVRFNAIEEIDPPAEDIEIIINTLNESIEARRDEIGDEVMAIDASDADEPINDIKEHLSDALEKANEVENLEAIRKKIEKQQDEQKENEKDKKIAELTAKVDAQQMALRGRDIEISSLGNNNRDLSNELQSAERHIYDLRRELDYRSDRRCHDTIYRRDLPYRF